jgi:hypothetical protein
MPATTVRPAAVLRDRVVRRAEVVGVWAVDCVRAQGDETDWAGELLGDPAHHHALATLELDGYHLDEVAVECVARQQDTAYVRMICRVSVRPSRLPADLARRTLRGLLDELLLAPARTRRTSGRLIDAAISVVPAPAARMRASLA